MACEKIGTTIFGDLIDAIKKDDDVEKERINKIIFENKEARREFLKYYAEATLEQQDFVVDNNSILHLFPETSG